MNSPVTWSTYWIKPCQVFQRQGTEVPLDERTPGEGIAAIKTFASAYVHTDDLQSHGVVNLSTC